MLKDNNIFEIKITPFRLGILLSVMLHLLVVFLKLAPSTREKNNEPLEISQLTPEQLKKFEEQIVETEKLNNEVDPNAEYLSDHNQKADKQTKSARIDDFKKGANAQPPKAAKKEKAQDQKQAEDDVLAENTKKDWKELSLKDLSISQEMSAPGASDDKLENVQQGDQTILSTREFRYFSYYHRIKELLRQHWKPNIEARVYKMWERGRQLSSSELTTKVLVLLSEQGAVRKISKVSGSGVPELDEAAVEAFEKAAPFPNPPKGIIDSDGFVRIRWDFILQTEATPRIQFQTGGVGNPQR
jgi:protein TonB